MMAWLAKNWDWMATGIFVAIITSTIISLRRGTKGGALLLANSSSALMAFVLYPFLEKYDYQGPFVGLFGVICGACGVALFSVLIAVGDTIERRRANIAADLVNRVVPERDK